MKVLVVIPAYNEQDSIVTTVQALKEAAPFADYIVVNDASVDQTLSVIKQNCFPYISLPINLGIGGAVQAGYRYALGKEYDIVVQMDGDGQHDPAYLSKLIEPLLRGEADIAIGSRFIDCKGFQSSGARRMGIRLLNCMIRMATGLRITDCTSGYRAVNRKVLGLYANYYPVDYPEPEAIVYGWLHKARIQEVPVIMKERTNGVSSIRPIHSLYYMMKVSLAILSCRLLHSRNIRK